MGFEPLLRSVLFGRKEDALEAIALGAPGAVINSGFMPRNGEKLHICFDWDSTVVDDEGDRFIAERGRDAFTQREWELRDVPCAEGPMASLFKTLSAFDHVCQVSIVTARVAMESPRIVTTMRAWDIPIAGRIMICGPSIKGPIVKAIGATLFFDDMPTHVESAARCGVPSAWVPYGPSIWEEKP